MNSESGRLSSKEPRIVEVIPISDHLEPDLATQTRGEGALLGVVYFISFFCGLTQCFEGVFLPEFKEYFHLSYRQQMYVVFAKNLPFIASIAFGLMMRRAGYKNTLAMAMIFYAGGTLLLVPGLRAEYYWIVLLGFFIIGTGFTLQMIAANPLMSLLGEPAEASSRLNLGNALGAVAQIIAPATLTFIIPAAAITARARIAYVEELFLCLGIALILVAATTIILPNSPAANIAQPDTSAAITGRRSIWGQKRIVLGFIALFLLLGVEASLFSFFRNYVESPDVAGLSPHSSQRLFTLYFAVFALGRLLASWIQKHLRPKLHVEAHLLAAIICLSILVFSKGAIAIAAFLVTGFVVSIFFPTLYAIIMENVGDLASQASGLLALSFLGCAIIPVLQGALADSLGLRRSFWLGIVIYLITAVYIFRLRDRTANAAEVGTAA